MRSLTLVVAAALVLGGCATAQRAAPEAVFPSAFLTSRLELGMTREDFQRIYPAAKGSAVNPRADLLIVEPAVRRSFEGRGMLVYLPQAIFIDGKLAAALLVYTYLGKTDAAALRPEELARLQDAFRADCEGKYGARPSRVETRTLPDGQAKDVVWTTPRYVVAQTVLRQNGPPARGQLIGVLVASSPQSPRGGGADDIKEVLRSIGLPVKL
jgi:hypothetical protein